MTDTYTSNSGAASSSIAASGQAVYNAYSALKKISDVTLTSVTTDTYTSTIANNNSRVYSLYYLSVISDMVTLVLSSKITAGTPITIAKMNSYKPAQRTPISIYLNSALTRRFMGAINSDGTIDIRSDEDMIKGTYYIFFSMCLYI